MNCFYESFRQWFNIATRLSIGDFVHFAKITGLSMSQITVLFHLHYLGPCEATTVRHFIAGSNAAASQIVERLAQQALVERHPIPGDRRVRQIVLTPKGQRLVLDCIEARQKWMHALTESLSEDEQHKLDEALQLLIEKSNQLSAKVDIKFPHPAWGDK